MLQDAKTNIKSSSASGGVLNILPVETPVKNPGHVQGRNIWSYTVSYILIGAHPQYT